MNATLTDPTPPLPEEGAAASLPPVTVARFSEAMLLLERIARRNVDVFADAAERYTLARRRASTRDLDALEAAQIASALSAGVGTDALDPVDLAERVQASGLRAQVDPPRIEALASAGAATAPAFLDACLDLVALVELPPTLFRKAREEGRLDAALKAYRERELDDLDLGAARARATAAFGHVTEAAGSGPGEVWGLVVRAIGTALGEATARYSAEPTPRPTRTSSSSSPTGSDEPTDGGDATPSTA